MSKLYRMKNTNHYWDGELPFHWKVLKLLGFVEETDSIIVDFDKDAAAFFDVESEDIII